MPCTRGRKGGDLTRPDSGAVTGSDKRHNGGSYSRSHEGKKGLRGGVSARHDGARLPWHVHAWRAAAEVGMGSGSGSVTRM
jgi:hypothetical protein